MQDEVTSEVGKIQSYKKEETRNNSSLWGNLYLEVDKGVEPMKLNSEGHIGREGGKPGVNSITEFKGI